MSTTQNRTSDQVGILRIRPQSEPLVYHYYSIIDLPEHEGLVIEYGIYDAASKTLNFEFSYTNGYPDESAPLKSYMTPVYVVLSSSEGFEGLDTFSISGAIAEGEEPITKTGSTANQKKKVLVELNSPSSAAEGSDGSGDAYEEIKPLVVVSATNENDFFVIGMAITSGENSRVLLVSIAETGEETNIAIAFDPLEGGNMGPFVAASNFMASTADQFDKIVMDNGMSAAVEYVDPEPTQV